MRFLLLLITYILLSQNALAQRAVVGLPSMNMFYIGIENPIEVAVDGVKAKNIVVEINGGKLKGENGKYTFIPDGSIRRVKLKVGVKNKGKVNWVDSSEYRVRKVPRPEVLFGTKTGGKMSRGELLTVSKVNAGLAEGFVFEGIKFIVKSYRVVIVTESFMYTEEVNGARISPSLRSKLMDIQNGGILLVDNVVAESKHTTEILGPAIFNIDGKTFAKDELILHGNEINENGKVIYTVSTLSYNKAEIRFSANNKKDSLWQLVYFKTGKPLAEYFYKHDTLKWTKTYFSNGDLKSYKNIDGKYLMASYIEYYQNGSVFKKGKILTDIKFHLIVDAGCYFNRSFKKDSVCDLDQPKECLFGDWEVYYENGILKELGTMDTTYNNTFYIVCKISIQDPRFPDDPYKTLDEEDLPEAFSVRHGLWKFYDEKGNLIRQTIYNKGHIKED